MNRLWKVIAIIVIIFILNATLSFATIGALVHLSQPGASYRGVPTDNDLTIQLNGRTIYFDQKPIIKDGRILVPIRGFFTELNADILWDDASKTATITMGEKNIQLTLGKKTATVGFEDVQLDVPALLVNGRVLVPMRFIVESLGAKVDWDGKKKIANIKGIGMSEQRYMDTIVKGDARFIDNTMKALKLLSEKSPDDISMITTYLGIIAQDEKSGTNPAANPPIFYVGNPTSDASTTWYASALCHDALHSKLYSDYRKSKGGNVPNDVWSGSKAEMQCLEYQIGALEKVDASPKEIDYAKSLRGTNWWDKERTW